MNLKAIILFAALVFAGCNAVDTEVNSKNHNANNANNANNATPAEAQTADNVKRVTTAELDELMKQGKVVVVDVRSQTMYDAGHIPGAKLIPVGEIGNRANELPKDKQIVTYCS
ncbi:MAG TPA: rhodanese-like domain-containing protein [Pyrinomonadaceae bacterium]|nr:rhodanese-like domain-containing protein [Pyrinomonadaceae bacterium]